jgi:hypothetical protein
MSEGLIVGKYDLPNTDLLTCPKRLQSKPTCYRLRDEVIGGALVVDYGSTSQFY